MSAFALADQLQRMRMGKKASPPVDLVLRTKDAVHKKAPTRERPVFSGPASVEQSPATPTDTYGGGPRQVRDDPYGAGDVYPVFQVDDPRMNTKQFLNAIQRNRAIGRLPKDMYQSMWHFLTTHHTHWKREAQMAMWRDVADFYKLVKNSKAYPGWTMTYDFDERLSKDIAPFQETVVLVFRDLARQLGVALDDFGTRASLDSPYSMMELTLDAVGPQMPSMTEEGQLCEMDSMDAQLLCTEGDVASSVPLPESPEPAASCPQACSSSPQMVGQDQQPLTRTEQHLLRWFRESNKDAKHRVAIHDHACTDPDSTVVCVPGTKDGECRVTPLSHKRMKAIEMVLSDGSLPMGPDAPDPMPLYWIQAKPEEFNENFGRWDPVGATWIMHTDRNVVPVERRYAPFGVGYGTNPDIDTNEPVVRSHDFFSDCGDIELYNGTGLEPGVKYIQMQAEQLDYGVMLGAEQGWGKSEADDCIYYTPQLRHLEIDHSVAPKNVSGIQYVYGWFGTDLPVYPETTVGFEATHPDYPDLKHPQSQWDSTNACWIFPLVDGKLVPKGVVMGDTERERDSDLQESMSV